MATTEIREQREAVEASAVLQAVQTPAVQAPELECADCMYHIPHATTPDGWCACRGAKLAWHTVEASREVCEGFAVWPEGSPVPAFIAAMRF